LPRCGRRPRAVRLDDRFPDRAPADHAGPWGRGPAGPSPPPVAVEARDFSRLTLQGAFVLAERQGRYVVELDSYDWPEGGLVGWQCQSADQDSKTVCLREGTSVDAARVIVEGRVSVVATGGRAGGGVRALPALSLDTGRQERDNP
jgi:hypothetical protein